MDQLDTTVGDAGTVAAAEPVAPVVVAPVDSPELAALRAEHEAVQAQQADVMSRAAAKEAELTARSEAAAAALVAARATSLADFKATLADPEYARLVPDADPLTEAGKATLAAFRAKHPVLFKGGAPAAAAVTVEPAGQARPGWMAQGMSMLDKLKAKHGVTW
jgi:hypothetical protein